MRRAIQGWGNHVIIGDKICELPKPSDLSILILVNSMLKRLRLPFVDLLSVHNNFPQLKKYVHALNICVENVYARGIGLCPVDLETLKKAQSWSRYPIVALQVGFSLSGIFLKHKLISQKLP